MSREQYLHRAGSYFAMNDDFQLLVSSQEQSSTPELSVQDLLKDMLDSIDLLLAALKHNRSIDAETYNRLRIDPSQVKLPQLYFLTDLADFATSGLKLMIVAKDSATWKIGLYLDQLLRPFVTKILQQTTFRDEADFMRQLNIYSHDQHRLQQTTLFAAIKSRDFYTMDVHENVINIVGYFLEYNTFDSRVGNVSIQIIKNLLHIYLYNNVYAWQKKIYRALDGHIELFGRCKDEIFFTWNKTDNVGLQGFLQDIRETDRTVRYHRSTGAKVEFMNIRIENRDSNLFTSIYHESGVQKYRLPYVVGHTKLAHSDWLRSALIRAACCCTSVDDCHTEKTYLEVTLLANGYSLVFIDKHVQHFFDYFHASSMRYSMDQVMYKAPDTL
ncbi:unnamed protein product [Rotaria socialis]|nr:unnamed protein product [Rotaria socialis]